VFAAAAEVGVPLAIVLVFALLRDSPPDFDCGDPKPSGQDARVDDFRAGAIPLHLAGGAILAMALLALSRDRVRAAGKDAPVGTVTAVALIAFAFYVGISLVEHDLFFPLFIAGFLTVGLLVVILFQNFQPLTILVAIAVVAVLAWLLRRPRVRGYLLATLGWAELLLVLPGSLALIYLDGRGPLLC